MSTLFVAVRSESPSRVIWGPVGRLDFDGTDYSFVYTQGARTLHGFRPFDGMLTLDRRYVSKELFPIFFNRLMPKRRAEYNAYLKWSGFNSGSPPDPIALLAVTEGIRQTDSIELFAPPTKSVDGNLTGKFFLHGLSKMTDAAQQRVSRLLVSEQLRLVLEPTNTFDVNAVGLYSIEANGYKLGFVPRYLAKDLNRIITTCGEDKVAIFVDQINDLAPFQQRLLCRVDACWPDGFVPHSDPEFVPLISQNLPRLAEV